LNAISHHAQFSKFHFIRLFKKVYGTTPSQYLLKVRLDRAQALLANGYSVFETSALIGFESPTSFAGSFKKQTQYTPSAFQKKQIQRADDIIKHPLKFVPNCFAETHGFKK
jgi:AraC-like DNA-binding protein